MLAADAAFIEIANISGAFKDLRIVAALRGDRADTFEDVVINVGNGTVDTGSNYRWTRVYDGSSEGQNSSESDTKWLFDGCLPGDNADAGNFGMLQVEIAGYADTNVESMMQWAADHYRSTQFFTMNGWGRWEDSAVIDVIRFTPGTGNWRAGSSIRIYGEPVIGQIIAGYSPILDHKATIDTPDDEFDAAILDAKWTAVSGVAGTVDPFAVIATNTPIYDLATRKGWLLTQVRQNDGATAGAVRLRQDFTLADGDSIVVAHTLPTYSGLTAADNESAIEIVLNDTDSDSGAGNRVVVRWIVASAEQVQVYGGLTTNFLHNIYEVGRIVYTRILRKDDGATEEYYIGLSEDGTNWNWAGASAVTGFAPGVELTNLWITHSSTGGGGTEESPIVGFFFVRQGTNNLDPWGHTGLIQLDSVPEWMTYLAHRLPGETPHADDDFFGQDSSADYTDTTPTGTVSWGFGLDAMHGKASGMTDFDVATRMKLAPVGSAPLTIETAVSILGSPSAPYGGLIFADGTAVSSNAIVGGLLGGGSRRISVRSGTLTNISETEGEIPIGDHSTGGWLYVRFIWSAANTFKIQVSPTGADNSWSNLTLASSFADTLTPTHMGFFVSDFSGVNALVASFVYLRVYELDKAE